jgi:choice-of-anchor B domain-containing protein
MLYFRAGSFDVSSGRQVAFRQLFTIFMSKSIVLLCCVLLSTALYGQNNFNLELLGRWDDDSLPVSSPNNLNLQYNACWGMAVNNREYAIMGGAAHVLVLDVTDPYQPQLAGKFQGRSLVVPREFKSYKNRFYAVADGGKDGLMIINMSNAPTEITQTYWDTTFFKKIHTIALDTVSGRLYLNGGNAGNGIMVLDVSQNPDLPTMLGHVDIPGGYVHDCYVRNDTVYASSGYEGYYVFDYKDPLNPKLLAQISTGGYNHNSWLTLDGKYAYYAEEIPAGMPMRIVDLQNLSLGEIEVVGSFIDNLLDPDNPEKKAIPHNVYIKDDLLFDSQYEDGLLVYDISNRLNPVLIAHYDTRPENTTYNGYFGNWGNYPWLPSGTIISSDMQNGLFLFRLGTTSTSAPADKVSVDVFPNPASDRVYVNVAGDNEWNWRLGTLSGVLLNRGTSSDQIVLTDRPAGMYLLEILLPDGGRVTRKIVH